MTTVTNINCVLYKNRVAQNFGSKAEEYNQYAHIQRLAASKLAELAAPLINELDGIYLELGCGTGFVTQHLCEILQNGTFEITDISVEMLQVCQNDLRNPNELNLLFSLKDAENVLNENNYDLIINALSAQWFADLTTVFNSWLKALKPGGLLLYSYLDSRCFPQWKKLCSDANLPYTANLLPEPILLNFDSNKYELEFFTTEIYSETYKVPSEFFGNLKRIGAGTRTTPPPEKSARGIIKQLDEYWLSNNNSNFCISYGITFAGIRRKAQ
jgi:malonyl-CoA O-methyltransferase